MEHYKLFSIDLKRDIHSVLGLPFDCLDMVASVNKVFEAVDNDLPLFISTPNLNFLIASRNNSMFQNSVINSDLSLADGMPIIWLSNFLNIPIQKRVSGSGLFESLMISKNRTKKVKVFFFGGMDNNAEQACLKLKQDSEGIRCVGSLNPGYGSIEEMSTKKIISIINRSGAEFIVVSLGAQKGQAWIELNRNQLNAPVISHLGAVVNFISGNILRAPLKWQINGIEWLWRIREEPSLLKRYLCDGIALIRLFFTLVLPYRILIFYNRKIITQCKPVEIMVKRKNSSKLNLIFKGIIITNNIQPIRKVCLDNVKLDQDLCINLMEVDYIDTSFMGLLFILYKYLGNKLTVIPSQTIKKVFTYHNANFLLKIDS